MELERTELGNDEFKRLLTEDIRRYVRLAEGGHIRSLIDSVTLMESTTVEPQNSSHEALSSVIENQTAERYIQLEIAYEDDTFLPYDSEGNYWG